MEILETLDKEFINRLLEKHEESHDIDAIKDVLSKRHVLRVKILAGDFETILINSSNAQIELLQNEYPNLGEVIRNIMGDDYFFTRSHSNRGLNGKTVKEYYEKFLESRMQPESFFIVDRADYPQMNKNGLFYVRDGMHHLVAYGLAVQMQVSAFPIFGYYGKSL